jgi:hypothetical protein
VLDPIWYTKVTTASRVRGRTEKVLGWDGHLDAVYPTKERVAPVKHHVAMPFRDVICFEFLQRPENVLAGYLAWRDYRGKDAQCNQDHAP